MLRPLRARAEGEELDREEERRAEAHLSKPPRPTYLDKGYDGPSKAELGWRGRAIHRARFCRRRFVSGARATSPSHATRSQSSSLPRVPLPPTCRAACEYIFDDVLGLDEFGRIDDGTVDIAAAAEEAKREENQPALGLKTGD